MLYSCAFFFAVLFVPIDRIKPIRRVPYFILLALLFFFSSIASFVWLFTLIAISNGFYWILYDSVFLFSSLFGFCLGFISRARSLSAYGKPSLYWLALLPLVNLILVFKPPLASSDHPNSVLATFGNVAGILFGLILFSICEPLSTAAESAINDMVARGAADPEIQFISTQAIVRTQGLEEALRTIATGSVAQRIDETTELVRSEASGSTLRYIYEVAAEMEMLPETLSGAIKQSSCDLRALQPIIDAGASIEYIYRRADGSDLGLITVTSLDCAF